MIQVFFLQRFRQSEKIDNGAAAFGRATLAFKAFINGGGIVVSNFLSQFDVAQGEQAGAVFYASIRRAGMIKVNRRAA